MDTTIVTVIFASKCTITNIFNASSALTHVGELGESDTSQPSRSILEPALMVKSLEDFWSCYFGNCSLCDS